MAARFVRLSSSSSLPLASASVQSIRLLSNSTNKSLVRLQQLQRTMATSAPTTEWLAVVPDKPNTLAKRLEVRPTHFANLDSVMKTGRLKFGGAILNDKPNDPADPKTYDFAGSSIIYLADSKQEVIDFLKTDVYYESGVWDVENAQIYALRTAIRVAL